jgi:hypothetical protein
VVVESPGLAAEHVGDFRSQASAEAWIREHAGKGVRESEVPNAPEEVADQLLLVEHVKTLQQA